MTEAGPALTGVTAISASHFAHTCAVLTDGSVDCWGNGALGNGASTSPKEAVPVAGLSGAIGVAVGDQDSCALLAAGSGTVECWGANFYAQVGDGTSGTSQDTPVPVVTGSGTLSGVVQISGGGAHTCGLLADGTVDCWGENAYGQLGVPTTGPDQCFPSSGCSWNAFAVPGLRLLGLTPTLVLLPSPLPPSGGPVTYAVTVAGAGPPTPTGLVTISDGHQSCTSPVIAGAGQCPLVEGPGTPFTLTANYGGDPTYGSAETSLSIVSAPTGGGTVNVSSGGVTTTATASGTGAVTETTYPTDPVQAPSFNATGNYFDVALSPAGAFTSVTIKACNSNVTPGTTLEWWNPAGAGSWVNVVGIPNPPTYTPGPPPPCITLTLNGSTNPTVAQLTHTVFGVARPTAKPSRPTAVFAVPGNGQATAHWTKPASDGGTHITTYTVTSYVAGVAKTAKTFGPNATGGAGGIMTLLTNAKSYTFKVTATNAVGTSPPSTASTAITVGAPTAPTQVHAQKVGAGHLKVTFAASASNGAPIQKYTATCKPSTSGATGSKTSTVSPVTVAGLTAGKSYTCTVTATNSRGTGPSSTASLATNA